MKRKVIIAALVLTALATPAMAFSICDEDLVRTKTTPVTVRKKLEEAFKSYNIDISRMAGAEFITITCGVDKGYTTYSINDKGITLIKSTDTCQHEKILETKEITIYRDLIPYLIVEDYAGWKKHRRAMMAKTWGQYGER